MVKCSIPTLLGKVKDQSLTDEQVADLAVELAGKILSVANENQKVSERYQGWKMARMMDDPMGKTLTLAMAGTA